MKALYVLLDVIGMRTPELRQAQPMRHVFSHGRRRAAMASYAKGSSGEIGVTF